MENNLFTFATKELSQDAILAWCISAVNDRNSTIYECGIALLQKMLGIEIEREKINHVYVKTQYRHIDILIIIDFKNQDQMLLIIEDKTNSSIHDNQLQRYVNALKKLIADEKHIDVVEIRENAKIRIAYVKTGYMTDIEEIKLKEIENENKCEIKKLGLDDLIGVFQNNSSENQTLKMYTDYIIQKKKEQDQITGNIKEGDLLKTSETDFGQWELMKKLIYKANGDEYQTFEISKKDGTKVVKVKCYYNYQYVGSSFGTPWTQYCFWSRSISDNEEKAKQNEAYTESLFWRIDPGKISLRYYVENAPETLDSEQSKHLDQFRELAKKIKKTTAAIMVPKIRKAQYEFALIDVPLTSPMDLNYLQNTMREIQDEYMTEIRKTIN